VARPALRAIIGPVENGTDVRARLAQLEEDFAALSDQLKEAVQLHSLATRKLAAFLVALTAEVMSINQELIADEVTSKSKGAEARDRLRDIFENVEIVMKAMKEVTDPTDPPPQ